MPEQGGFDDVATEIADVVGPVCETGDFLAENRAMPRMEAGELLAVFDAGAYAFSMSSNYNARVRGAEVIVKEGEHRLIRRRETYEDLIALEQEFVL
jgi:diaminopimelate decarboxylase